MFIKNMNSFIDDTSDNKYYYTTNKEEIQELNENNFYPLGVVGDGVYVFLLSKEFCEYKKLKEGSENCK